MTTTANCKRKPLEFGIFAFSQMSTGYTMKKSLACRDAGRHGAIIYNAVTVNRVLIDPLFAAVACSCVANQYW